jgi:hypothetical protein
VTTKNDQGKESEGWPMGKVQEEQVTIAPKGHL